LSRRRHIDHSNSYQVYRYVLLITNAVIPKAFWGSKRNLKVVLQCGRSFDEFLTCSDGAIDVMEFITCRRYETLSLHHVLQRFSTADCDWLILPGPGARRQARVSVSDALKRRELLEEFLFWYLDSFVLPLLRASVFCSKFRPEK
jgi:telomerase reverse transcriptase